MSLVTRGRSENKTDLLYGRASELLDLTRE
jgi:hypothetical protein